MEDLFYLLGERIWKMNRYTLDICFNEPVQGIRMTNSPHLALKKALCQLSLFYPEYQGHLSFVAMTIVLQNLFTLKEEKARASMSGKPDILVLPFSVGSILFSD
jgi:hypothetical protein